MSLVIKSQRCCSCDVSDMAGLDLSCIATITVIGGYYFRFPWMQPVGIPCSTFLLFKYMVESFMCIPGGCSSSLCLLVLSVGILKYHSDHCMFFSPVCC